MNEKPEIEVGKLPVITKFIYTLGVLPTSYLMSMTYQEQVTWLYNYLQTQVIPLLNTESAAIQELQTLYELLRTYVNDYFDNLDVQEEINNKIDEMVSDGTFQSLINNYAEPILNDLTDEVEEATTNVNNLANNVGTIVDYLRKKYYSNFTFFKLPNDFSNEWFKNIQIFRSADNQKYTYSIDIDSLKNTSANPENVYVDCNFTGSSLGTEEQPYKTLQDAFANTSNGDTIYVKKGIYHRESLPYSNQVKNNVNIICEKGTIFTTSSALTWTQNSTYTNVYQATRSNSTNVIYVKDFDNPIKLINVASLEICSNTLGSYYTDNTNVYVNIGEEVTNDNIIVSLAIGQRCLNFEPNNSQNMHIYLENATCINSELDICHVSSNNSYTCEFIAKNCKFLYCTSNQYDGISCLGAKTILIDCLASGNKKDGFNYHSYNNIVPNAIEINCIGSSNGLDSNNHNNNGSTIHDGGKIVRINGNYLYNNGANVADVQTDTISVNIQCNSIDSTANTENAFDSDFCTQQAGATMYLYNCFAKGNSYKNIFAVPNSTIYVKNSNYDSSEGNVIQL